MGNFTIYVRPFSIANSYVSSPEGMMIIDDHWFSGLLDLPPLPRSFGNPFAAGRGGPGGPGLPPSSWADCCELHGGRWYQSSFFWEWKSQWIFCSWTRGLGFMVNYDNGFASYHLNPVDGLVIIIIQHEPSQCINGDSWWIIHSQWQSLLERDWIINGGFNKWRGRGFHVLVIANISLPWAKTVNIPQHRIWAQATHGGDTIRTEFKLPELSGHSIRKDVWKLQGLPHRWFGTLGGGRPGTLVTFSASYLHDIFSWWKVGHGKTFNISWIF